VRAPNVNVVYPIVGLIFAGPGVLFLYGSLQRDPRWTSRPHRLVAILTGLAMFVLGSALFAAAWTSRSTSRELLIAGSLTAFALAVVRWLVRYRWERSTTRPPG
jgi:hypothetical protein